MDRILIIEDSMVVREKLREYLEGRYVLEFTETGALGVAAATDYPPDLILLDIHLPEVGGYDVCRLLKNYDKTRSIPILFLTGLDSDASRARGFEAGGDDYIIKPFSCEELLARIGIHLSARRAQAQTIEFEKLKIFRRMTAELRREMSTPLTSAYASLFLLEKELAEPPEGVASNLGNIRRRLEDIRDIIEKLPEQATSASD